MNDLEPRVYYRSRGMATARWLLTLALLSAVTLTAMILRARSTPPQAGTLARPDLNPWALLGCYELAVEPWGVDLLASSERDRPQPTGPAGLAPRFPSAIMLRPDSLDEWGRPLGTYRVVALGPRADSVGGAAARDDVERASTLEPLRWFTSADTLWILGSLPGIRAGVMLFDTEDSLTGRARLLARAGSVTATVHAVARPINCATRETEAPGRRPRR